MGASEHKLAVQAKLQLIRGVVMGARRLFHRFADSRDAML
jgi:hypothetical protein